MEKFATVQLKLKKSVSKGETYNLIALFSADERFKRMDILTDAEEGDKMRVEMLVARKKIRSRSSRMNPACTRI